eukprot:TRINITY_DN106218_c0_g1_i1.p1 TRINITY_DN106218_c0_g1~~TRINITY_DN106218_c0_g1_i1.p1  ORF type:complete len:389 (-),score=69.35 TRINITY_DN106218_c0_g1_i1:181-1320(-)
MSESAKSISIGLIADIQYADCDDGSDFSGKEHRYFRNSIKITQNAVECWNAFGVHAVVQLGDIIDGCNTKLGASETAMRSVLNILEQINAEHRFDLIGNHELYNIPREALPSSGLKCLGKDGLTYYTAHIGEHWEAIFLDPYEQALIGLREEDPGLVQAKEVMMTHNPGVLEGDRDWFEGLPVEKHRYVPYNGGVSANQIDWLKGALQAATADKRKVLVFLHVPLYGPATKDRTVVWNAEDILNVLHAHAETVIAVFAGHDHDGGYAVDSAGLHHITMNSPLTATPGTDCFAVLECHADGWAHFHAHGRACVESNTGGKGRAYTELILAKGSENQPAGAAVMADSLAQLVAMGFDESLANVALEHAGGNVEVAAASLCA